MYSVISKLGLTVTLDLDKLVTLQLLAILANPLVTLQLNHVFNRSRLFGMFTRTKQSGEIQQNDTLHGLLVMLSGGFCFHAAAGHEKKMTHSQL